MRSCFGFSGVDGVIGRGEFVALAEFLRRIQYGIVEFRRNVPPVCQVYML